MLARADPDRSASSAAPAIVAGPAERRSARSPMPGRTGCPRCSMPGPPPPRTTAAPSPASPPTRRCSITGSASPCCSAASPSWCRCWRSPARWRRSRSCRASAGTFPTTGPLFIGLLIGVIIILGGLQFLPADRARAARGTFRDARRQDLLRETCPTPWPRTDASRHAIVAVRRRDHPPRRRATRFAKLNPATLMRNPVIFVTEIVAVLITIARRARPAPPARSLAFPLAIAAWLWLTVLFATFAEAVAEGRGRARAESLRRARTDTMAKLLVDPRRPRAVQPTSPHPTCAAATWCWSRPAT